MLGILRWITIRLFISLIAIIIASIIAEIYLNEFSPQLTFSRIWANESKCFIADAIDFYNLKPNSTCHQKTNEFTIDAHINNLGFRSDKDMDLDKMTGKKILFLGDSFTYGHGVKTGQTYPDQVGKILNKKTKVEILNAGVIGTETTRSYLYLRENLKTIRPDIVVYGLYLGNDLGDIVNVNPIGKDSLGLPLKMTINGLYLDSSSNMLRRTESPIRYKIPVLRDSNLFIFLADQLFGPSEIPREIEVKGVPCYLDPTCKDINHEVSKIKKLLSGMESLSKKNNFKLIVVIIPWEIQLKFRIQQLSGVGVLVSDERRHYLSDIFANYLEKNKIPYVDLLDYFDKYEGSKQIFYPQDRHWTVTGNTVAAQAIAPYISAVIK